MQIKKLIYLNMLSVLISCSTSNKAVQTKLVDDNTFLLTHISTDPSYGYAEENPIKVGGIKNMEGPLNERRFLNALAGPNGETVTYRREGSCCSFKSKNGFMGTGLLDAYRVSWEGSKDTFTIYINMYDSDVLKTPIGFTIKK
jgi:hypothetical protein